VSEPDPELPLDLEAGEDFLLDKALRQLRLVDRNDPAATKVAKKIIELARPGERDPIRLREQAVASFRKKRVTVARLTELDRKLARHWGDAGGGQRGQAPRALGAWLPSTFPETPHAFL
jgi:hypothetical protein